MVNENGEELVLTPASQALQAVGSRWPYPHRADGTEDPEHWADAGPGAYPGASPGDEPPGHINDMATPEPHGDVAPRGSDDSRMPRRRTRNRPASRFPDQGTQHDEAWPPPQATLTPGMSTVGAPKQDAGHPVVGAYQPRAPRPAQPGVVEPEVTDPADEVERWSPGNDSDVAPDVRKGGPADFNDPNPVHGETVYLLMSKNFPPDAIGWVKAKTTSWVGPVWVPWDRVDTDDKDKWAASHQPAKVKEFQDAIKAHAGHVAPSILVQEPGSQRAFIVDGHHRAVARENLGQKVLAYLGNVDPKDLPAARETHSKQIHSGSDPRNT